jgi:hypothetical protein
MKKLYAFLYIFYSFSFVFSQNIIVNEICTKNSNIITDGDFNQFADWVELFNEDSQSIDLSGYFLTDDTTNKTKWQFPANSIIQANEYLVVWADDNDTVINNYHTNFKLKLSDDLVGLYDAEENLVDLLEYAEQYSNISYGKAPSGYGYFSEPTPGNANFTNASYTSLREDQPSLSIPSGFYIKNTELTINDISPGDLVRYTTDGSFPHKNSTVYTEPIILSENTILRAVTYGNALPSEEVSCSYMVGLNKQLPVVSLIINPDFLWSDSIGIFNDFEIEKRINWERASKIQYFKNSELQFETENEIRLFGATAYLLPQKSFSVFADNQIQYKIFDGKNLSSFDSFIMRSSSDDWTLTMLRDGFVHTIVQDKLNIDYLAYQPTVLYINGEYFGIFNLREKYNEDYLEHNHGVNKDSIDMLRLNYWWLDIEVLNGTANKYIEMLDYLNSNDMTDDDVFAGISEFLDIDNYTNYIITQIYIGNRSYKHNIKAWRKNNIIDGFKWLIYDTDRAYMDSWRQIFLMVYESDPVLNKLLENINYRNHFLQQTCSHINSTFRTAYIKNLVDSLKNNITGEMPHHIQKWLPHGGIQSIESWNNSLKEIFDFSKERKDTLLFRLDSMYNLSGQISVQLKKTSPRGGKVYIEDVLIPYNDSSHTYFKNVPVKLVAKPNIGYSFIEWEGISTNDTIIHFFQSDEIIHAIFEANCDFPNIITEDAMLLKDCSPYHFSSDITVENGATLYCEPGVEIYFGENVQLMVYGGIDFMGTAEEAVTISGEANTYWKYIKSDGGDIKLSYVELYSGEKAISFNNGGNITIENCTFYESDFDGDDLISGHNADVIFINNTFYGNPDNNKRDCIDCKSIDSGTFSDNLFYDITDDCIDIGNESENIFIQNNSMFNCQSMGVSIGESTVASISRNIIAHCSGGIQVHTDAIATIMNNTLFDCEVGIQCYHYDNTSNSGGTAYIVNTIISQCEEDYALQPNSQIDITYSLSDKILHIGTGNIFNDPQFLNITEDNFQLADFSPCIDAGDILSQPDPDGTRADIGAIPFNHNSSINELDNPIKVYPNPFSGKFIIKLDTNLIESIDVFTWDGRNIYHKENINSNKYVVDIQTKGLILVLTSDNKGNKYFSKLIEK